MQAIFTVTPVFILIGLGYVLQQKKRLSPQTLKENSFFLYWFAIPATLLNGILSADISAVRDASFFAAVWSPFVIMLVTVWMTSRRKEDHGRFAALMLCSIRGNNFYTGIPIISLAMGKRGVEAGTLILAFTLVAMQLLSIGGAQLALFGSFSWRTVKSTCLQLLKNPLFLSCILGLFLVATGLNSLPSWMKATLAVLSDVSTGLALIMLGAGICLQNIFKTVASVWRIVLFKLAVFPAVTYVIYTCLGLSPDMVQAGVLLAGMPVAVNTVIIAKEMGMDSGHCAMGIAVTVLLSLLTLPFMIHLLGLA